MPNLRRLRVSDIDPLCYPDDVSLLIFHAKQLEDLRIQWSPRMRQEAEPSISLRSIFGKCLEAGYKPKVKHLGLQNFYGPNTGDLKDVFDPAHLESADFLEVFGGTYNRPTTIWVDETWKNIPDAAYFKNYKTHRVSEPAPEHAKILSMFSGLREMYMISKKSSDQDPKWEFNSPITAANTPATPLSALTPTAFEEKQASSTCKAYLQALTMNHGQSLTKLLLSNQWPLSGSQIGEIVSKCPNLEQVGFALAKDAGEVMSILSPFFTKLRAVRILPNANSAVLLQEPGVAGLMDGTRTEPLYWRCLNQRVRYCGLGDAIFRIDKAVQLPDEEGNPEWYNRVTLATLEDVQHLEIWGLDKLEL
jgi:hypothetical protein